MDEIDIALQKMGIKLMPLKRMKILDSLSEEEKAEIQNEDVLEGFNVYVKVRYVILFFFLIYKTNNGYKNKKRLNFLFSQNSKTLSFFGYSQPLVIKKVH